MGKEELRVLAIGKAACCGRCKEQFGRMGPGGLNPYPFFSLTEKYGGKKVWEMSPRGIREIQAGRRPTYRRKVRSGPSGVWQEKPVTPATPGNELVEPRVRLRSPAIIACPKCGSWNHFVPDPPEVVLS